jgi:hypothetical protein
MGDLGLLQVLNPPPFLPFHETMEQSKEVGGVELSM